MISQALDQNRSVFIECLRALLRPAMKFCRRRGLKIGDVLECAKAVFLEVAAEHLEKEIGSKVSVSRLSLITGVQRPEVVRIYKEGGTAKAAPNIPAEVLGRWRQSSEYTTSRGKPRVLSVEGSESEFCSLVRSVTTHVNPYTVLFELERLGAVERCPKGVRLNTSIYVPSDDIRQGARMMAGDAEDLMEAVEENLASPANPPNYHLVTDYGNVAVESIPAIREWIAERAIRFHEDAQKFFAKHDKDVNPSLSSKPGGVRVLLGGFSRIMSPEKKSAAAEASLSAARTDVQSSPVNDG